MYQKNLTQYKTTQILTANPGRIVLMLYDGALSFLEQAAEYASTKAYFDRAKKINKVNNILLELIASLDLEQGGDIAVNLREIYSFLVQELLKADIRNDAAALLKCRNVLVSLRDAWAEIVTKLPKQEAKSQGIPKAYSTVA